MSGKVYVVQEPNKIEYDGDGRANPIPLFNLDPARVYGDLVNLLPPGNTTYSPQKIVEMINTSMPEFTSKDYICPVGSPAIIGVAIAIAAKKNGGRVNVLHWNKREKQYRALTFEL